MECSTPLIGNIHFGGYRIKVLFYIGYQLTGQSTLIIYGVISVKYLRELMGGISLAPLLTGVAIGRDVLGGTNATIGLVAYNNNAATIAKHRWFSGLWNSSWKTINHKF